MEISFDFSGGAETSKSPRPREKLIKAAWNNAGRFSTPVQDSKDGVFSQRIHLNIFYTST